MNDLDDITTLGVVAVIGLVAWFGYSIYEDYKTNANDLNAAGPGGSLGADKPASFGSFVDDSLFSIGQSPQDLSTAQSTFFSDPFGTFGSIFNVGRNATPQ
jgi:hypothetical protein